MTAPESKKENLPRRVWHWLKENMPLFAWVLFGIALLAFVIHMAALIFPGFADFFNIRVAGGVRFVLAKITSVVPISLSELFVYCLPLLLGALIAVVLHLTKKERYGTVNRIFCGAFALLSVFYTLFVFTLGTGYHGKPLDEKLDLQRRELTSDELAEVAQWLIGEINDLTNEVNFKYESTSVMPCGFAEMNDKLCDAYGKLADKYDFIMGYSSRVKPVLASAFMTKMGMLGMYSYYTGESNVNVDYFDYNIVYTCAHELSHQRGISKEDEANFMAFLVCLESDDPYIRYAGYLNIYEYVRTQLSNVLTEEGRSAVFTQIESKLAVGARIDMKCAITKNKESAGVVRTVTNTVHEAVLSQSDPRGTASYGFVVDLVAAYYLRDVKQAP